MYYEVFLFIIFGRPCDNKYLNIINISIFEDSFEEKNCMHRKQRLQNFKISLRARVRRLLLFWCFLSLDALVGTYTNFTFKYIFKYVCLLICFTNILNISTIFVFGVGNSVWQIAIVGSRRSYRHLVEHHTASLRLI